MAGEEPTPTQRLVTVADSGNGLSGLLDFDTWWFINTDLSFTCIGCRQGEWIFVSGAVDAGPQPGSAWPRPSCTTTGGRVGRGAQSLLVGQRSGENR